MRTAPLLVLLALAAPAAAQKGVRRGGDLVVDPEPVQADAFGMRLRSHVKGALTKGEERRWAGPPVPEQVALTDETRELFLLDPLEDGTHLAFYRDPYGAASCSLGGAENCAFSARLYGEDLKVVWSLRLDKLFSRPDRLEIQDVRMADGVLYFNEACQSYAKEAGKKCSALVAVDPVAGKVLWRSKPLTSNNMFLVFEQYIVAGYGFTAEPDFLYVIRRSDGKVVHSRKLASAQQGLAAVGDRLVVNQSSHPTVTFLLVGFDGARPRLVPVKDGKR